jgi:hypothetical protein
VEQEHVVAQDIRVQGDHSSFPGSGEQRGDEARADAPALPAIFHHDAEIGAPLGICRQGGQAYAAGAAPGQVRLVLRVLAQKGREIGRAVGEPVEAVEKGCPRASGRHGHDSTRVRHGRLQDSYLGCLGHAMVRPPRRRGGAAGSLTSHDSRHNLEYDHDGCHSQGVESDPGRMVWS